VPGLILDGHKLNYHRERVEAWRRGERVAPITIDCSLTRRCNYRCVYCYGQLQANDQKKMTREVIYRFLDDAAEIGVKAVSFISDGESTCSPHLYDAVAQGRANGLDIALGTNGYLLKDERLEEILPALTYLRFNISAGQPRSYARIMGCKEACFDKVGQTIKKCARIKAEKNLPVTIGLQMVLLPEYADQVIPLARLGRDLDVDYLVIKHCSDDENSKLKVDYDKYFELVDILGQAETFSTEKYLVKVKWSKILSRGRRQYDRCYGPPLMLQLSGSGLVAPCGMLFNDKYKQYHIGNIAETSFKDIWRGDRYWQVMDLVASDKFDPATMCGTLCLQHKVNEFLYDLKHGGAAWGDTGAMPCQHVNFI
jgi:MoaA/NifB/PqqE/SkfB family radical SAM enzyme